MRRDECATVVSSANINHRFQSMSGPCPLVSDSTTTTVQPVDFAYYKLSPSRGAVSLSLQFNLLIVNLLVVPSPRAMEILNANAK